MGYLNGDLLCYLHLELWLMMYYIEFGLDIDSLDWIVMMTIESHWDILKWLEVCLRKHVAGILFHLKLF